MITPSRIRSSCLVRSFVRTRARPPTGGAWSRTDLKTLSYCTRATHEAHAKASQSPTRAGTAPANCGQRSRSPSAVGGQPGYGPHTTKGGRRRSLGHDPSTVAVHDGLMPGAACYVPPQRPVRDPATRCDCKSSAAAGARPNSP